MISALIAAIAISASGDVQYWKLGKADLSSGQKQNLRALVLSVYPDAQVSNVQQFPCATRAGSVQCGLAEDKDISLAEFADLDESMIGKVGSVALGVVHLVFQSEPRTLTSSQRTALGAIVAAAFPGIPVANVLRVEFYRQPVEDGAIAIRAKVVYVAEESPQQYAEDYRDGLVAKKVGVVP